MTMEVQSVKVTLKCDHCGTINDVELENLTGQIVICNNESCGMNVEVFARVEVDSID
jgi:hypothetical protein